MELAEESGGAAQVREAAGNFNWLNIGYFDSGAGKIAFDKEIENDAFVGKPPQRMGLAHPSIAPYGVFRSKDGKGILISIQSEREWKKLCAEVLDQPDLPNDPRFANMVERVRNRSLTDKTVADSFATMTRVDLLKRLADADIAFAEVNTMADLAGHPHLRRIEVETPNGTVSYAAPAAIFVGDPRRYGAVPAIGQHRELPKTPRARIKSS
jgi:formyl-CoA transferase